MKAKQFLIILFAATVVLGCKKSDKKAQDINGVIEEETIDQIPRKSDESFANAIESYKLDNKAEAAKQIHEGIVALNKEGKNITGLNKFNFEIAIDQLTNIAGKLENEDAISVEDFKEAIANAEINVAHSYLSTDKVYVLERPDNIASNKTKKYFDIMFSNLKKVEGKMKPEAKKDGEALLKEGKALENELKTWEKKAKAYTKKTNEHFEKHNPEYYFKEFYWN
jgi:hypothetical protein